MTDPLYAGSRSRMFQAILPLLATAISSEIIDEPRPRFTRDQADDPQVLYTERVAERLREERRQRKAAAWAARQPKAAP